MSGLVAPGSDAAGLSQADWLDRYGAVMMNTFGTPSRVFVRGRAPSSGTPTGGSTPTSWPASR